MSEEDIEEKKNKKTAKRNQDHREKQEGEKDKDEIYATTMRHMCSSCLNYSLSDMKSLNSLFI
jgi:hypothetical protein